jgi:hypothetical protein
MHDRVLERILTRFQSGSPALTSQSGPSPSPDTPHEAFIGMSVRPPDSHTCPSPEFQSGYLVCGGLGVRAVCLLSHRPHERARNNKLITGIGAG